MLCDLPYISETRRLAEGIYQSYWWNFERELRDSPNLKLDYPDLGNDFPCCGVCDSPEQLLTLLPESVREGPRRFVVSMVRMDKANEPPSGGWRWHKWGTYIGNQNAQCEYLADEPDIETVWTYHVYELDQE